MVCAQHRVNCQSHIGARRFPPPVARVRGMGNNLGKLRNARGWTQDEAAERFAMSPSGYRKLEYGERELKASDIERAADIYGVSVSEVLNRNSVKVVGRVGAGAEMHFYADGDDPIEEAPMPPNGGPDTVAVEVNGNSLGPLFNRAYVYYDEVRTPPTDDLLGRLCVVGLPTGQVLVKQLAKGSRRWHYHLISQTEEPIFDAQVIWAAVVKAIVPRL